MRNTQMMNSNNKSDNNIVQATPVTRVVPAVDSYETDDDLILLADLPGLEEQNLQIEISHGLLTIEAEKPAQDNTAGIIYYRQFKLPERIDADAGEAALKDGVLTLRLPKNAAAKPKKIAVKTLH